MTGMSRKEIARLVEHIEPQGVNITRTKKGLLLRLPDQTTTMLHFSGSDHRERDNVRTRLKRAGVSFPGDGDPLGPAITDHRPARATLQRVTRLLAGWDQKQITVAQLIRLSAVDDDAGTLYNTTAARALYHLGWTPHGKATARKWWRPLELEPDPVDLLPDPVVLHPDRMTPSPGIQVGGDAPGDAVSDETPTPGVETPGDAERAAESPTAPPTREFLDSHDSFTGDIAALPETLTVRELRGILGAFGLQLELRTWRP